MGRGARKRRHERRLKQRMLKKNIENLKITVKITPAANMAKNHELETTAAKLQVCQGELQHLIEQADKVDIYDNCQDITEKTTAKLLATKERYESKNDYKLLKILS